MRKRPLWLIIIFAGIEAQGYAMKSMANSQIYTVRVPWMDLFARWEARWNAHMNSVEIS